MERLSFLSLRRNLYDSFENTLIDNLFLKDLYQTIYDYFDVYERSIQFMYLKSHAIKSIELKREYTKMFKIEEVQMIHNPQELEEYMNWECICNEYSNWPVESRPTCYLCALEFSGQKKARNEIYNV